MALLCAQPSASEMSLPEPPALRPKRERGGGDLQRPRRRCSSPRQRRPDLNGVVMCTAECERDEPARATSSPTQARTRRRRSPAPSSPMFEPSSTLPAIALPRPSMLSWYFFILYWGIGNRIRRDILGEERAGYVEQIVSTLSRQLTSDYGAGF